MIRGITFAQRRRRRIRLAWTCTDYVHHEHRFYWTAWVCGRAQWIYRSLTGRA